MAKDGKKGLGVGLEALFGEEADETAERTSLPIEKVEPRADQPRRRFDETSLAELSASIAEYGVIQPITVRPLPSGYYQIVAGERRWRAARMAGLREVPVRVITADEQRAMEMALVENLQREDLNPIEEAQGYRALLDDYGLTQEEAARRVGKSRPAVTNALRLLSLSAPVRKLVEDGELSAGHARALAAIPNAQRQLEAARSVVFGGLSVRRTEALAARLCAEETKEPEPPKEAAYFDDGVDYLAVCARHLEELLGRRVRMKQGRRTGRIELEYYGADDREALIEALETLGHKT